MTVKEKAEELLDLIKKDVEDKGGKTSLIVKAEIVATLNPLSDEKKFEEEVVCYFVNYFNVIDQIDLSSLESYIDVCNFPGQRIIDTFSDYVHFENTKKDIVFIACVVRMVQNFSKLKFNYSYLRNRFKYPLLNQDPWLYVDLIISVNWKKSVKMMQYILSNPVLYDASYFFSVLPTMVTEEKLTEEQLSDLFNKIYKYFNEEDKLLADYYSNEYGFDIIKDYKDENTNPLHGDDSSSNIFDTFEDFSPGQLRFS